MAIKILPNQLKRQISYIKDNYFTPSLKALTGNILEVGCGKGENFKHYSNDCSVFAIDKKIRVNLLDKVKDEIRCNLNIQEVQTEYLQYKDELFDAVVGSFVLCSVESLESTFDEMSRVLKKGGKLIFIEHIKSNNRLTKIFQKILSFIQGLFFIDCRLDRDPRDILPKDKFNLTYEKIFLNSLEPYLYFEAIKK